MRALRSTHFTVIVIQLITSYYSLLKLTCSTLFQIGDTMKKLYLLGIMIMFGIISQGCSNQSDYHLVIKNTGDSKIDEVIVSFDDFNFEFGIISSQKFAKHSSVGEKYPLPEKATIEWQTEGGIVYKKTVEIKNTVPKKFKEITVIISINGEDDVAVSWKDGNTW